MGGVKSTIPVTRYCPPASSGCVGRPARRLGAFFPSLRHSWGAPKPTGEALVTPREFGAPILPSTLWLLLTQAFYSLWLKEIVWQSKTFFEGGALLIRLWSHLAWCPAQRSYSLSVY